MRIAVMLLGGLVLFGVLILAVGAMLPVRHVAAVRLELSRPPAEVYAAITDVESAAAWRSGVERIELLSPQDEKPRWRESTDAGVLTFVADERVEPTRVVNRIDDPELPFGGRWIYEIQPHGSGSLVTITEEGEVYNPLFRVMSRFLFGHHGELERYARDLARHFGEDVAIRRVEARAPTPR